MISETNTTNNELDDLLNRHFPGKVVRKDLTKLVKEGANVPVYVLEYLLVSAPSRRFWQRTTSGPTKPRRLNPRSGSAEVSKSSTR